MSTAANAHDLQARLARLADRTDDSSVTDDPFATLARVRGSLDAAAQLSDRGRRVPDDSRLRGVKQAMSTGLRSITEPQAEYNASMVETVLILSETLDAVLRQQRSTDVLAESVNGLTAAVDRFAMMATRADAAALSGHSGGDAPDEPSFEYLIKRVHELRSELADVLGEPAAQDTTGELRARMAILQARQNLLVRAHAADATSGPDEDGNGADVSAATFDDLYQNFEDRFRGSRSFVADMLGAYVDDITRATVDGPVIDIGCGRGEWLELLQENEISAYGLDQNSVAIARCRERNLDARDDDVIEHLTSLEPGSVRAVTAFHVVEHLPFDTTVALLDAALVALAPGGMLILETPNPTNLTVGGSFFWIDPTHIRPMHPDLLEFLVTERGFTDAEVRYLHPRDALRLDPDLLVSRPEESDSSDDTVDRTVAAVERVNDWIFGHLDYVVIARKAVPGEPTTTV